MPPVIRVENLGKQYRLGEINRKMLYQELQSWWARVRGKEDPNSKVLGQHPQETQGGMFWALRDINFEVEKGDVVGIIGKNGSGKSTLLKILSEITTPTTGQASIRGSVASLLEVGTGFHVELTGRENVYLNGSILGMKRAEIDAKYDQIAEFSGVQEFMDTPVKRYSSGMKLRLAFSVAAHLDPEILILDEVLAVGDADFQQKCLGRMGEVARGGRTILFVSHNMAAVQSLCNKGIVLSGGRVVFAGTADDAVTHYIHTVHPTTGSLRDRKDRGGSGKLKLIDAELRDLEGRVLHNVWTGQDVDLVLTFENSSGESFPNLLIDLNVKNESDVTVFKQDNRNCRDTWQSFSKTASAVCRLRQIPLVESNYRIEVAVASSAGAVLDHVDDALEFAVHGSNFFGSDKLAKNKKVVCVVRGDWTLEA